MYFGVVRGLCGDTLQPSFRCTTRAGRVVAEDSVTQWRLNKKREKLIGILSKSEFLNHFESAELYREFGDFDKAVIEILKIGDGFYAKCN